MKKKEHAKTRTEPIALGRWVTRDGTTCYVKSFDPVSAHWTGTINKKEPAEWTVSGHDVYEYRKWDLIETYKGRDTIGKRQNRDSDHRDG